MTLRISPSKFFERGIHQRRVFEQQDSSENSQIFIGTNKKITLDEAELSPRVVRQVFDSIMDSSEDIFAMNDVEAKTFSYPPGLSMVERNQMSILILLALSDSANNVETSHSDFTLPHDPYFGNADNNVFQRSPGKTLSLSPQISEYNRQLNDEVCLLERIESAIHLISQNYDPFCPICLRFIDVKRCNFQNISAYYSNVTRRHYLTHFECSCKASKTSYWKKKKLSDIPESQITPTDDIPNNDIELLIHHEKKMMAISIEASHPIGGTAIFRLEKVLSVFEDSFMNNYIFFYDLENRTPTPYEPSSYLLPFSEFTFKTVVALTQSPDEPLTLEFFVNATTILANAGQQLKNFEISFKQGDNQIILGVSAVADLNHELANSLNFKVPWNESHTSSNDLSKNRFLLIRYLKVIVPMMKRTKLESRKTGSTLDLGSIKIDEDEEFGLAYSPAGANLKKKFSFAKEQATPLPLDSQITLECGNDSRTINSMDSPDAGLNRNASSFSSYSSISNMEGSSLPKGAGPNGYEASQFSHHAAIANQQSIGSFTILNKANEFSNGTSSSNYSSLNFDHTFNMIPSASTSLAYLDEAGKNVSLSPNKLFITRKSSNPDLENNADFQRSKILEYRGQIGEMALNPAGNKVISQLVLKASQLELDIIISEITPLLKEIMVDPYLNYMLLTLLQHASIHQRMILFKSIIDSIPVVARHKKGTHSLQSIIALVKGDEEEKLFEPGIQDHVLELSKDSYATHFIQKMVNCFSMNRIAFIFNMIICNFLEITQHSHGLCVLKAMITKTEKDPERKTLIIQLFARNIDQVLPNPFSNYVVQHALEVFREDCKEIWDKITSKAVQFSTQKFSSGVIENCLETCPQESRKKFIDAIITNGKLLELMTNKYGNSVLQKVFSLCDENAAKLLMTAFKKQFKKIHSNKYRSYWMSFFESFKNLTNTDDITNTQNDLKQLQQLSTPRSFRHNKVKGHNQTLSKAEPHEKKRCTPVIQKEASNSDADFKVQGAKKTDESNYNEMMPQNSVSKLKKINLKKTSQSFAISQNIRENEPSLLTNLSLLNPLMNSGLIHNTMTPLQSTFKMLTANTQSWSLGSNNTRDPAFSFPQNTFQMQENDTYPYNSHP